MITTDEIKKLAELARIDVTEEEIVGYTKDFGAVLGYVDQINNVNVTDVSGDPIQINTTRNDDQSHVSGQYCEVMLANAPASQDGFYKVPKIL
jgi:aspartyl-tRNA(Asn)/glutamyl-tRNA(Gln) amidotransferase subunit C